MQRSFTLRYVWSEVSLDSPERVCQEVSYADMIAERRKNRPGSSEELATLSTFLLTHRQVSEELQRSSQHIRDSNIEESGKADM